MQRNRVGRGHAGSRGPAGLALGLAQAAVSALLVATGAPTPVSAQDQEYVQSGYSYTWTSGEPGWLGVNYQLRWVEGEGRCEPQVLVERTVQGSPAERAGLRAGDVILTLDGEPVPAGRITALAARLAPGDSIRLRVDREGEIREITAVADRRPARPPAVLLRRESSGLEASSAPIVHVNGERLIARNVEGSTRGIRGYWLASEGGRPEYRRLSGWSNDALDTRVVELLRCAEEVEWQPARTVHVNLRQLQERADSLRVAMAQRVLERQGETRFELRSLEAGSAATTEVTGRLQRLRSQPSTGTYVLRIEDYVAAGMRGVAGAELTALEPELAAYFDNVRRGLLVLRIAPGTPAARAGLVPGDVVVEANGASLASVTELRRILSVPDGQEVRLEVIRKGRVRTVTIPRP